MRLKIKVLVPVWGESYVRRFVKLALPSLMAEGNLPTLTSHCDVEILILTTQDTIPLFEREQRLRHLARIAPVKYIQIDDLVVPGAYGVTLTLVYMRGIGSVGPDMVNTYFVFLNADFVLADGSLRSLLHRLAGGARCVLAPSFRAVAEDVEPKLEHAVNVQDHVLALEPRAMVRIAMGKLHPTTLSKTVNQGVYSSTHPNQLYWLVNESTMLGRFFLIFMFCIKPERELYAINSYCDYGFVPELCPSTQPEVITDSDEFFMLECQSRLQEIEQTQLGRLQPYTVAQHLSEWTTKGHRFAATHNLIFHSGDLPREIVQRSQEADRYVRDILGRLSEPKDHAFHHYWVGGVMGWLRRHPGGVAPAEIPELAVGSDAYARKPVPRLLRSLQGWLHQFPLRVSVRAMLRKNPGALLVGDPNLVRSITGVDETKLQRPIRTFREILGAHSGTDRRIDVVICFIAIADLKKWGNELIQVGLELLHPDGQLILVYDDSDTYSAPDNVIQYLAPVFLSVPREQISEVRTEFLEGRLRCRLRRVASFIVYSMSHHGVRRSAVLLPLLFCIAGALIVTNVWSLVRRGGRGDGTLGSAIVRIFKR